MTAIKHDAGKSRFSLVPVEPLSELVKVYDIGCAKYGRENWRKGMDWSRVYDAMMRHLLAWWGGEKRDPVDGQHHLASVAFGAMTLMWYELRGVGCDDRSKETHHAED